MFKSTRVNREELLRPIAVFFISLLLIISSMIERNWYRIMSSPELTGQDYFKVDLTAALILALLVTVVYLTIRILRRKTA